MNIKYEHKSTFLILGLYLIINGFSLNLFAQENYTCGTALLDNQKEEFIRLVKSCNKPLSKVSILDSIVPLKYHIISFSDSSGGVDSNDVLNEINNLNQKFDLAGISFEHCGSINFIYSDHYASFERQEDEIICNANDVPNVVNIYLVPELYKMQDNQEVQLCGYTYYFGDYNRLIIRNSCAINGSSLAHELGHYFSLLHTHETSLGEELVQRVNCAQAGDELCDTPADPGLSEDNVTQSCFYIGNEVDASGEAYSPDTENIMSYSRKTCRTSFTSEQIERINNYFFGYRNYLYCIEKGKLISDSDNLQFILFPNPGKNNIALITNQDKSKSYNYKLFDIAGKVIHEQTISNYSFLDISFLDIGTYFVVLEDASNFAIKKLIKSQ